MIRKIVYFLLAYVILSPTLSSAEGFPDRPIRMIIGFSAGGPTDTAARLIGDVWGKKLGQSIVIENKTGANGLIATRELMSAKPDGYTIYLAPSGVTVVAPAVYKQLPYDMSKDFSYIGGAVSYPHVMVTAGDNKINNFRDVITGAKSKQGLQAATVGYTNDLTIEWINQLTGGNIARIPYRGHSAVLNDLKASRVDIALIAPDVAIPLVQAKQLKGVAVTSKVRTESMKDIPTISEQGLPDLDVNVFSGFVAPRGTPQEVVDKLSSTLKEALKNSDLRKRLEASGQMITPSSGREFAEKIQSEIGLWKRIADAANIKLD